MRIFIFVSIFIFLGSLVANSYASDLIQFQAGKPAVASDVNSNFNTLEQRITALEQLPIGGCSATQLDNSVLIECADGTSGVIAGAGTVLVYPEGQSPSVDISQIKTGDIIVADANGVVLAKVWTASGDYFQVELQTTGGRILAVITNNNSTESVDLDCYSCSTRIYFEKLNCEGQAFVGNPSYLLKAPDGTWLAQSSQTQQIPQVTESWFENDVCHNQQIAELYLYTVFPYIPAQEILNAAYPVKLKQLP